MRFDPSADLRNGKRLKNLTRGISRLCGGATTVPTSVITGTFQHLSDLIVQNVLLIYHGFFNLWGGGLSRGLHHESVMDLTTLGSFTKLPYDEKLVP